MSLDEETIERIEPIEISDTPLAKEAWWIKNPKSKRARQVWRIKQQYKERPEMIIEDMETAYGNLSKMLQLYFPDASREHELSRERLVYCIMEILSQPDNVQLQSRFTQMHQSCQAALWMKGQSKYFNAISRYELPTDASPAAIMALGKFWMQNAIVKKEEPPPELSSDVKEAKRINAELESED